MSDQLRGRQDDYRRALADPIRFDVAFYAGLYVETLEAEVERLTAERDEARADAQRLRIALGAAILAVRDKAETALGEAAVSAEKEDDT